MWYYTCMYEHMYIYIMYINVCITAKEFGLSTLYWGWICECDNICAQVQGGYPTADNISENHHYILYHPPPQQQQQPPSL